MRSLGSVPTKSINVFAGSVVDPPSWTFAPIQQVIPISRLVADNLSPDLSVERSTLPNTGRVLLEATARPTILKPLVMFS